MLSRFSQSLLVLVACLTLASCSRTAPPQAVEAPTIQPTPRPTIQPTRPSVPPTVAATTAPNPPTSQPAPTDALTTALPTAATPTVVAAFSETGTVANGGNVRITPVTGQPLDQVNIHETVRLIGKNADGTWYLLVTPRDVTGWVSATLLTIEPAVAARVPIVPATTQGTAADAWTTHTIEQSTIQLPPTWQAFPLTEDDLERAAQTLDAEHPELAQIVRQMMASPQFAQIRFLAIDTGPATTGANVNLVTIPRPDDVSPNDLLDQVIAALPSIVPDMKLISGDSKHQVNGLPAGRVVYDLPSGASDAPAAGIRGVQWYVIGAENVYVITISGPAEEELISLADRIGRSFVTRDAADGATTTGDRRQIINGGNLRRDPKVTSSNVIGQVCPGDQVALLEQPAVQGWTAVRVAVTGPDCDPKRVAAGTEGWVSTTLLGPVPQDGSASLPPSLLITKLVPFTHAGTGIGGLRPENWTIFETGTSFQISSSPEAPDGFLGKLIAPSDYPSDGAAGASRTALDGLKQNHAEGPPPEILEEQTNPDGSGVLLVSLSSIAQGSTTPVRMIFYARTTVTPRGVLLAIAVVPADLFTQEEALVRQMVDSLHVTD
jgi:hypothetical protein